ncbi:hypothetical protein E1B28_010792 [Marasmius oreades]|uniref:ER-bound oxygenase mpaB/mpaB'/Rubber oxygenase catalytic domain-containing protein n=1 Tax=Marasmius oreades TaxID=181124 RepID=A0A9P7RU46_9AGAR|nr:uncharacterized protein E1B28_010792 [Marasmius oreades]KAG7089083.1 hypothetical protein E1B28_010792 [Marasmius oreades]
MAIHTLFDVLPYPTFTIPALILFSWVSLVRTFRWRRYNYIHRVYGPKYSSGMLTPEDAQDVITILLRYEMPLVLEYAVAFSLFKTYAIPSISKILWSTKELASSEKVSKRYADTSILISTWMHCPISGLAAQVGSGEKSTQDPRSSLAVARTNWLHSRYNITNDDYLYTLALFMFEPAKWAAKYGWRPLSPLEQHAFFMFWVEIGKRMNIKDIPKSETEFKQWVEEYEDRHMVPAQTNHDVATYTTEELIHVIPEAFGIKSFVRKLSIAVLEDNVRVAMMQPKQPVYMKNLLDGLLGFMAWHVRYFHLPAWKSYSQVPIEMPKFKEGEEPLMTPCYFQPMPWYKPRGTGVLGRLKDWGLVKMGVHDAVPSERLRCRGYRLDSAVSTKSFGFFFFFR